MHSGVDQTAEFTRTDCTRSVAESIALSHRRAGRVLTVDPRIRRIGVACFEGPLLVDWAIKNFRQGSPEVRVRRQLIPALIRMLDRCEPTVLLLPELGAKGVRRSANVREVIAAVQREASDRGIDVCSVSEMAVRAAFEDVRRGAGRNKVTRNEVITRWFPELEPARPRSRRLWESERYAVPLFDSIGRWVAWYGVPSRTAG